MVLTLNGIFLSLSLSPSCALHGLDTKHGAFRTRAFNRSTFNFSVFCFFSSSFFNYELNECTCFFHFASSNFAQFRQENRISAVIVAVSANARSVATFC